MERTSELTGILAVTLYRWIKDGKIEAIAKRAKTGREFLFLDVEEVQKIVQQKEMRRKLAKRIAKQKEIDSDSARRWIKRMENKGQNPKEIIEKVRRKISKTV